MIDYRHLRAGNYILVEAAPDLPRPHKVMAKDIYDIATGKVTLAAIDGIRLCPHVLEKCAFEKVGDSYRMEVNTADELAWYVSEGALRYQTKGAGFTRIHSHCYLHQLQNLYFALTGQELPVNL